MIVQIKVLGLAANVVKEDIADGLFIMAIGGERDGDHHKVGGDSYVR